MIKTYATAAVLGALLASGPSFADDRTPSPPLNPAERAALKTEAANAREARAVRSPEQKRAATVAKQQQAQQSSRYGDNDIHALDVSPEEAARLRDRKAIARDVRATQSPADKKAARSQKQKDLDVSARAAPGA